MKKTLYCLILFLICILSACGNTDESYSNDYVSNVTTASTSVSTTVTTEHIHKWAEADCLSPKTCLDCGKTEGKKGGHTWQEATCTKPKTCTVCGKTKGKALGHKWKKATCTKPKTCSVCGTTKGDALGHKWEKATCLSPKKCSVCGKAKGEKAEHKIGYGGSCVYCGQKMITDDKSLEEYLNNKYSEGVTTPLGDVKNLSITVYKGTTNYESYDYCIKIDDALTIIEYNYEYSREYTQSQKNETANILKNYVKNMADDVISIFPDKKVTGGFYYSYYKYPHIKEGYTSNYNLTWTNYELDSLGYVPREYNENIYPSGFRWASKLDEIEW